MGLGEHLVDSRDLRGSSPMCVSNMDMAAATDVKGSSGNIPLELIFLWTTTIPLFNCVGNTAATRAPPLTYQPILTPHSDNKNAFFDNLARDTSTIMRHISLHITIHFSTTLQLQSNQPRCPSATPHPPSSSQ